MAAVPVPSQHSLLDSFVLRRAAPGSGHTDYVLQCWLCSSSVGSHGILEILQCPQSAKIWSLVETAAAVLGMPWLQQVPLLPNPAFLRDTLWGFASVRINLKTGFCFFFPDIPLNTTQWLLSHFQSGRNPALLLLKPCHDDPFIPPFLG